MYEHKYLLGTSFARPLLAKRQVEIAKKVGADALAHGCTGKGNDQVRFELAAKALAPELQIIAPWREWKINSREDAIEYARSHSIPIDQTKRDIYSRDRNIWGTPRQASQSSAHSGRPGDWGRASLRDVHHRALPGHLADDPGAGMDSPWNQ